MDYIEDNMEYIEKTYELDGFLKLISEKSKWVYAKSIDNFSYFDGQVCINVSLSTEVIDFLQPYKEDIINMAIADEVVVCHGYQLDTKLTSEEEFEGCKLPQSLWDLKEKYNCCIEFIHCLVYDACKDVPEIGGIHLDCEDESFLDPYFVWTSDKDIAVRNMYMSNVKLIIEGISTDDMETRLRMLDCFENDVYNVFEDELSNEWFKYTFNIQLIRGFYLAAHYFHLYDKKSFDEKTEEIKNAIIKIRMLGRVKSNEALMNFYDVIDAVVKDTKEYLLEGKEIKLARYERHENTENGQREIIVKPYYMFEGNHWLRFLVDYCDLEDASLLYKAFLDYIILDKRFGVREAVEKDKNGNDVNKRIYYKVD